MQLQRHNQWWWGDQGTKMERHQLNNAMAVPEASTRVIRIANCSRDSARMRLTCCPTPSTTMGRLLLRLLHTQDGRFYHSRCWSEGSSLVGHNTTSKRLLWIFLENNLSVEDGTRETKRIDNALEDGTRERKRIDTATTVDVWTAKATFKDLDITTDRILSFRCGWGGLTFSFSLGG